MSFPDQILIPYDESERFSYVGSYGNGNQFMAYETYGSPKRFHTEESGPNGEMIWREHVNSFAVLHRFDSSGVHLGTDVMRIGELKQTGDEDNDPLEIMLDSLGTFELCDIRVKLFQVVIEKTVHGLIYESEVAPE